MSDVNLMADDQAKGSHTPGPWWISDRRPDHGAILVQGKHRGEGSSYCVASMNYWEGDTDMANARLIAAAPELLQGMKDLYRAYVNLLEAGRDRIATYGGQCDSVETMERGDPWLKKARDVVAKAEGQSCA